MTLLRHHHHHHGDTDDKKKPAEDKTPLEYEHEKTKRIAKNINSNSNSNQNFMAAFVVCLFCCFLCCVSTFQVLRQLTSWTPPQQPPLPPQRADFSETTDHAIAAKSTTRRRSDPLRSKEPSSTVIPNTTRSAPTTTTRSVSSSPASSSSPPSPVVFYNIYIRPNSTDEGLQRTLDILEDQLDQVGNSYAVTNNNNTQKNIDLYYNTIGAPHLFNHSETISFFQNVCLRNHLNCTHMQHYDQGYETRTLIEVHRYCRRSGHADRVVIYLHNKGSFHDSNTLHKDYHHGDDNNNNNKTSITIAGAYSGQDSWRRSMTAAATSQQCLEQLIRHENPQDTSSTFLSDKDEDDDDDDADDVCDACGLLFQPLPYEHYPGNMWSARCSYIQRLVSPFTLRAERITMMEHLFQTSKQRELLQLQKQQRRGPGHDDTTNQKQPLAAALPSPPLLPLPPLQANLFPLANAMTGGDRYLSEFWLGSHPWLRPCDLSKTISLQYWKDNQYPPPPQQQQDDDNSTWELSHGPRGDIANASWEYYKYMNPNTADLILHDTTYNDDNDVNDDIDNNDTNNSNSSSAALRRLGRQRQYQEFFLLPGRLVKWMYIYNATPRKDSWMWSWFPHGQEWKQQIIVTTAESSADGDADDSSAADSDQQHHTSSMLTLTNITTTTTIDKNNNHYHQNQAFRRFQQYYNHVLKRRDNKVVTFKA